MGKGVEALPLKYIILIIIAAFALALILEALGIIRVGILAGVRRINETLNQTLANLTT